MKHWYKIDESVEVLASSAEEASKSICRYKRITLWDRIKEMFRRSYE